jgi:hypothetical protein|nr:MAG TPA: hypothetical protein [Caudoviricetes sp.]
MKGAVVIIKFCLNITSIGYPFYVEAINKYPCLVDEKYKMSTTRVWNKDKSIVQNITYIDISSIAKLKELIDETGHDVIIAPPRKWRDKKHYELEIYDDYRE